MGVSAGSRPGSGSEVADPVTGLSAPADVDALVQSTIAFGRRLGPMAARERWSACGRHGVLGVRAPTRFGGVELDALSTVAVLEALGYGCDDNGVLFALGAHIWACIEPIGHFGTEAQRQRWLPGLIDGTLVGGLAMTEPDAGSDSNAIATRALRMDDGWSLTGTKAFVTNATQADVLVVFARTGPRGFSGISAFVVPTSAPGVHVGRAYDTTGLCSASLADVSLDGCRLPSDAALGAAGGGAAVFGWSMRHERTFILAPSLGTMRRELEEGLAHARSRNQFGRPVASFPAVAERIARMYTRLHLARLAVLRAAASIGGKNADLRAAMAKVVTSEALVHNALDALENLGGYGFVSGVAERALRDSLGSRAFSGTNDVTRSVIGRLAFRW